MHEGQHDNTETTLHLGMFIEMVQDDGRLLTPFYFKDYPHPFPVRLISDLRDPFYLFVPHKPCNIFDQLCLVDLVWDLRNDDALPFCPGICLNKGPGPHLNDPTAGSVRVLNPLESMDKPCSRKVWAFYNPQQLFDGHIGIVDTNNQTINNLP